MDSDHRQHSFVFRLQASVLEYLSSHTILASKPSGLFDTVGLVPTLSSFSRSFASLTTQALDSTLRVTSVTLVIFL